MEKPTTCMLIDDDPDDHIIFNMAIEELENPVKCIFFYDCIPAFEFIRNHAERKPDFIFMDLNFAGSLRQECLSDLLDIAIKNGSRFIIYSNYIPGELELSLRNMGLSEFLLKKGSIPDLAIELQTLFR